MREWQKKLAPEKSDKLVYEDKRVMIAVVMFIATAFIIISLKPSIAYNTETGDLSYVNIALLALAAGVLVYFSPQLGGLLHK